jgi:hypothetical protein
VHGCGAASALSRKTGSCSRAQAIHSPRGASKEPKSTDPSTFMLDGHILAVCVNGGADEHVPAARNQLYCTQCRHADALMHAHARALKPGRVHVPRRAYACFCACRHAHIRAQARAQAQADTRDPRVHSCSCHAAPHARSIPLLCRSPVRLAVDSLSSVLHPYVAVKQHIEAQSSVPRRRVAWRSHVGELRGRQSIGVLARRWP